MQFSSTFFKAKASLHTLAGVPVPVRDLEPEDQCQEKLPEKIQATGKTPPKFIHFREKE